MDFLFSIFEFLIIAGGPFCVFAGMGKDKNVGKLTFRNLIAADSSIEITENGACVTLKSNSSDVSVPLNKVPWGTTSSITWGFLEVDTSVHAITGAYIIANQPTSIIGTTFSPGGNNLIVNPKNNKMYGACDSVIVTSGRSYMYKVGRRSAIIGGFCNKICGGDSSSIINSCISCNQYAYLSSILSSRNSQLCQTCFSSILSSQKSDIRYISTGQQVFNSTIISSYLGRNTGNNYSTIISSRQSYMFHSNALSSGGSNSIMSSCLSCINGGQVIDGITIGSLRSTVLASCGSIINDSCGSTIVSGRKNFICVYTYGGGNVNTSENCHNTIIGGYCNKIHQYDSPESYSNVKYNSILSSRCSFIYSNIDFSSIITSEKDSILSNGTSNVIIGGSLCGKTVISASNRSSIINSQCASITISNTTGIVGGFCQCISEGTYTGILGGSFHIIRSKSSDSSILGGCTNRHCTSARSAMIAGCINQITISDNSAILGGHCNLIYKIDNSAILGGQCSCIQTLSTKGLSGGVIIAGRKNQIYNTSYSVILGGTDNYIGNAGGNLQYSAILGGRANGTTGAFSVIVGSFNKSSNCSFSTTVTNLIFDKHVCISSTYQGRSGTIAPGIGVFKIRKGFITTT